MLDYQKGMVSARPLDVHALYGAFARDTGSVPDPNIKVYKS